MENNPVNEVCFSSAVTRLVLAVACALLWALPAGAAPPEDKLNVLFIAVDDLRPELNCYGATHIQSPNIDKLAQTGVMFNRAYCQQAVCSPSRTSLLTGLRPDSTKVYDLETHFRDTVPDVIALPQQFKNHGYHTVGMGKIYHGSLDDELSWSEPHRVSKAGGYQLPANQELIARKAAELKKKKVKGKKLSRGARGPATECADVPDDAYPDGATAKMAVETLGRLAKQDKPFFLAVGFLKPHLPFNSPKRYWDLYDRGEIKLADNPFPPKGVTEFSLTGFGELRAYEGIPKEGPVSDEQALELKHGYYASVSYTDAQIGRVVDELERLGLRDNTVIVLWGDHGWKLGEHGEWCKHTNFENDTRVVLMVSAPGAKANGRSSDGLVEFVDIYPTLCDLAGLPKPGHLEGTSFAPLLNAPDRPWETAAFSQYPRGRDGVSVMGYSIRTDRYRFIDWVNRKNPEQVLAVELYDHANDPAENENIAGDPANSRLVENLRAQLRAGWRGALPK
jgi:arylsulfatase A-like enzyme